MKALEIRENLTEEEFLSEYVAKNKPVVVGGISFDANKWKPDALKDSIGKLTTQIYDSLYNLHNISSLEDYMDKHFAQDGPMPTNVPYVRWYNQLKDVDFVWGDEAFEKLASIWKKPACVPTTDLIIPVTDNETTADPVKDNFPYRAILVAARGARTRMHRDPFCSDAIVAQFYGTKEAALYHPDRTAELTQKLNSFDGFTDVRANNVLKLSEEPDYSGQVGPGQMIFIPHGWLHDVLCLSDSVSITWNFIHKRGSAEFVNYLNTNPSEDSESDILNYFYKRGGLADLTTADMIARITA